MARAPEPDAAHGRDEAGPTAWAHGDPAGAADGDGEQQQAWGSMHEVARCCAAPLVAIMGLPVLLHLCEELLNEWAAGQSSSPHPPPLGAGGSRKQQYHKQRPDRVGPDRGAGALGPSWGAEGTGRPPAAAAAAVGACGTEEEDVPPVALLLRAVAHEGGRDYSAAVWGCLTRVLLRALGARGQELLPPPGVVLVGQEGVGSGGAAEVAAAAAAQAASVVSGGPGDGKGVATKRPDVEMAAAVLAAAEVLLDGEGEGKREAEEEGAPGCQGAAAGEGDGGGDSARATGAAAWERALLRAVGVGALPGGSEGGQEGTGRACMAAQRALQRRITSTTSAAALALYERALAEALRAERGAGVGAAGAGVAGGGCGDTGGEAGSREEWRDQVQLLLSAVHSRAQHLRERAEAEGLSWGGAGLGAGAGAGGPGGGAGRGATAALKTGDPRFAQQCLEEYARLGAGGQAPRPDSAQPVCAPVHHGAALSTLVGHHLINLCLCAS